MLSDKAKKTLEKQKYRIIGSHSAVKVCGWTKSIIKGFGGCYKLSFYGIMSHQCMQMTTSISCANRCTFCWRGYKAPVSREWKWGVDEPGFILEESKKAHHNLLLGIKGYKKSPDNALYKQSKSIKHVALSLTGEPIIYPKINELIKKFHSQKISTFIVTNAQYPEAIRSLSPVTQLYVSVDAPNKKILREVDNPLFEDFWERLNFSLDELSKKRGRTCIRLTLIKGINDLDFKGYAQLIQKGSPDFIEVKGYMHVGESTKRLDFKNMPLHEEVVEFSKNLAPFLENYEIVSEHVPSRVVLFAKKKFNKNGKWFTWIDFEKFHKLVEEQKDPLPEEFLKQTPKTGLSGKTTKEVSTERRRKRIKNQFQD